MLRYWIKSRDSQNLDEWLSCIFKISVRTKRNLNGKPKIVSPSTLKKYFISRSHTKNWDALAISDCEVGIDIEESRPVNSKAVFAKYRGECLLLRKSHFLRFWCRVEAVTKLKGGKLQKFLRNKEIPVASRIRRWKQIKNLGLKVRDLELGRQLTGAIAVSTGKK